MERKKLLLVVVLVVAIVAVLVASLGNKLIKKDQTSVCQKFIAAIQVADAQSSYNLFSSKAQQTYNYDSWKKQVPILQTAWGPTSKPKMITKPEDASLKSKSSQVTEIYEVTRYDSTYTLNCYLQTYPTKGYLIDGFTSEPKYN